MSDSGAQIGSALAEPDSSLVRLTGVWKSYGGNWALKNVSMTVSEGRLHALIGPNGAGKSTLFGVISGEHGANRGSVSVLGAPTRARPEQLIKRGLARGFQVARVFAEMTVHANVLVAVASATRESWIPWRPRYSEATRAAAAELMETNGLNDLHDVTAGTLPQGDRKRLEIAMALASRPKLLLLDEPTAGMSQEETDATVALVARLYADHHTTVLISEHDVNVVFALAEEVTVLHQGSVLCSGNPETVRADERVISVYLGEAG